jgi:outer membrane lipopolysaccharide assembly protein LptE/RlpB
LYNLSNIKDSPPVRPAHRASIVPALVFFAALTGLLIGCGYHMAGSGRFPEGIQTIAIPMFANRTAETGLETTMTNAVITELNRRRSGVVVDPEMSEAVLRGTIESLRRSTLSRKVAHSSSERLVTVTVSLVLSASDGRVLWRGDHLTAEQAYTVVGDDRQGTDYNLDEAIASLAQRLAENVVGRLTDDF